MYVMCVESEFIRLECKYGIRSMYFGSCNYNFPAGTCYIRAFQGQQRLIISPLSLALLNAVDLGNYTMYSRIVNALEIEMS
jgi:hypothetical protein